MTLTTIEKAAKMLGHDLSKVTGTHSHLGLFIDEGPEFRQWFNPYTNKADLSDVECAFTSLNMNILPSRIEFWGAIGNEHAETIVYIDDHPDKFTAKAHAVMAVVGQIYDGREG